MHPLSYRFTCTFPTQCFGGGLVDHHAAGIPCVALTRPMKEYAGYHRYLIGGGIPGICGQALCGYTLAAVPAFPEKGNASTVHSIRNLERKRRLPNRRHPCKNIPIMEHPLHPGFCPIAG